MIRESVGRDVLAGAAGTVAGGLMLAVLAALFGKWIHHLEKLSAADLKRTQDKVGKWVRYLIVPALVLGLLVLVLAFAKRAHMFVWIVVIVIMGLLLAFVGARLLTNFVLWLASERGRVLDDGQTMSEWDRKKS